MPDSRRRGVAGVPASQADERAAVMLLTGCGLFFICALSGSGLFATPAYAQDIIVDPDFGDTPIIAERTLMRPAHINMMRAMLDWIGENSSYETAGLPVPQIRAVTLEDLHAMYYGRLPGPNEVFLTVEAIYHRDTGDIWINDSIEPGSAAYEATILHELVHHVQESSDREWACLAESEADAYALGDQYVVEVLDDESLKSDPLVVMFISTCPRW